MVAIGLGLFIISVLLVNLFGADIKGIPNKADYIFGFTAFSGIVMFSVGLLLFLWQELP
jgi:hypothetical protein